MPYFRHSGRHPERCARKDGALVRQIRTGSGAADPLKNIAVSRLVYIADTKAIEDLLEVRLLMRSQCRPSAASARHLKAIYNLDVPNMSAHRCAGGGGNLSRRDPQQVTRKVEGFLSRIGRIRHAADRRREGLGQCRKATRVDAGRARAMWRPQLREFEGGDVRGRTPRDRLTRNNFCRSPPSGSHAARITNSQSCNNCVAEGQDKPSRILTLSGNGKINFGVVLNNCSALLDPPSPGWRACGESISGSQDSAGGSPMKRRDFLKYTAAATHPQ